MSEPESGITLLGYDAAGNLAWSAAGLSKGTACDPEGDTAAILARKAVRTYDARNRVQTLSFPDGNGSQDWTYWPDGLPKLVQTWNSGAVATNAYFYNKRRLLTSEVQTHDSNNWTVGYSYNALGHLTTLTYPDGLSVAYAPNALGQPTQAGSYANDVSYFPNGAMAGFTYGNGIVHTMTRNARGLPEESKDAYGSTKFLDDVYDYDEMGNVAAITDGATSQAQHGNRTMTYDGLDRLTDVTSPMYGTTGVHYTYDVLDNLVHTIAPGRDQWLCYDGGNRLTNVVTGGDCSTGSTILGLGYDAQGNLANWNGKVHTFDYGNRLRSVTDIESYRYDAHGRRIRAWTPEGLRYSLYSQAGQLLWQRDARSNKRREYIHLNGSLVAERTRTLTGSTATVTYQHTDALGTPVLKTSASRVVLERREYEPYGKLLNQPLESGPGFTGHDTDPDTQYTYMQQRYFDPRVGRFWSMDPVTVDSVGRNFNRYWYGNNNPYRFTDPDGRRSKEEADHKRELAESRREKKERRDRVRNSDMVIHSRNNSSRPLTASGWTRPSDHPYVVGREGTSIEPGPGETRGQFLDDNVPGFHTMATMHDRFVDSALKAGVPDKIANIPSMGGTLALAVGAETINSNTTAANSIFRAIGVPVQVPIPFEHTHQQTLRDQLKNQRR